MEGGFASGVKKCFYKRVAKLRVFWSSFTLNFAIRFSHSCWLSCQFVLAFSVCVCVCVCACVHAHTHACYHLKKNNSWESNSDVKGTGMVKKSLTFPFCSVGFSSRLSRELFPLLTNLKPVNDWWIPTSLGDNLPQLRLDNIITISMLIS